MTTSKTAIATLVTIAIGKMVGKKREEVGKIKVPVPTLKDFGIDVEPTKVEEDGKAVYESDAANWLYNQILQGTIKKARNMLEPGTIDFKLGFDAFPKDLDELCAPAAGGGNPEAALAVTEFKNAFKAWLAEAGLAQQAQDFINAQVASPKGLAMQPEKVRGKIEARLSQFAEAHAEDDLFTKQAVINYLTKLMDACEAEELDLDAL